MMLRLRCSLHSLVPVEYLPDQLQGLIFLVLQKALELNARLTGELLPGNMVNVQVNNNVTITDNEKEVVLKVVQRHPEIYSEILTAMVEAGL